MTAALWYYHSGQRAIVFPSPTTGKPVLVPTAALRAAGWMADDDVLRLALPRAELPGIQQAPAQPSIQLVGTGALRALDRARAKGPGRP
jgi:hypothetical protein